MRSSRSAFPQPLFLYSSCTVHADVGLFGKDLTDMDTAETALSHTAKTPEQPSEQELKSGHRGTDLGVSAVFAGTTGWTLILISVVLGIVAACVRARKRPAREPSMI